MAGCTLPKTDGHYSAEFSYDPQQYMIFLAKEIQGVENQINSAMSLTVMVIRDEYPADRATTGVRESLSVVSAARSGVDVMRPPVEYTDTRERVLEILDAIEREFSDLIVELKSQPLDRDRLTELKNLLHGDSVLLAAVVNAYWK